MNALYTIYNEIKPEIDARLEEFRQLWAEGSDKDIFKEICFCVCTPQNNAQKAWNAVCTLAHSGMENGSVEEIAAVLRQEGVRFHKNKAGYIVKNRNRLFPGTKKYISGIMQQKDVIDVRNFFSDHVSGWGLKEASHFLRNIGFGNTICILDRHILRQLSVYNVITMQTLNKKKYLDIEQEMIRFANRENIPVDALDLVLWYKEKGELFK
ncbi:putative N-glycosylase/DNA lyase [Spirochaetia bacterium]|nr:putative N-glycosylase/DNA lyase [Spirochaetia bacterium]GHU31708.1 putative N-glycosylase/DNA lyase [Spirochaetia bacterium]